MSTIQIEVPESALLSTGQSQEEFVREAKFLLALKLFELGRLSSGKAAEMCGMNRVDFILLAGRSGVPVADLDDTDRDRAAPPLPRLSPANAATLRFLDRWLSTPDDKGAEWWTSFEEQLKSDRDFEERDSE